MPKGSSSYEIYQITYKSLDKKKELHGINGVITFPKNINECKKLMKEISSELSILFPFTEKKDWGKYDMSEGHYFPITFTFENNSRVMVACYDWNKKSGITDSLKLSLYTSDYRKYLAKQNNNFNFYEILTYTYESEKVQCMRVFLSILILIFNLQSWTKADDIRDFEIEGISIGNSLLNYLTKEQIKKKINSYSDKGFIYKSKDYYALTFDAKEIFKGKFDQYQFHLRNNDNNFVIYAIAGIKLYSNIDNCYPLMNEIHEELKSLFDFTNSELIDYRNQEKQVIKVIGLILTMGQIFM